MVGGFGDVEVADASPQVDMQIEVGEVKRVQFHSWRGVAGYIMEGLQAYIYRFEIRFVRRARNTQPHPLNFLFEQADHLNRKKKDWGW